MLSVGAQQQGKRGRPQAPAEQHADTRSASGVVGTAGRARSGAEQRAITTVVAALAATQNGTSGVLAAGKYARRRAARATAANRCSSGAPWYSLQIVRELVGPCGQHRGSGQRLRGNQAFDDFPGEFWGTL